MTTHQKVTEEKVEDEGQGWFGQTVNPEHQGLPGHFSPPGQQGLPGVAHAPVREEAVAGHVVENEQFEAMRKKAVEAKKMAALHPQDEKLAKAAKAAQHEADEAWKKAKAAKVAAAVKDAEVEKKYFEKMREKAVEAKKMAAMYPDDHKKAEEAKVAQHKADAAWKKAEAFKKKVHDLRDDHVVEEFEMVEVVVDQGFAKLGASQVTPETAHSPGQMDQYGQRVHLGHENIVGRTASHPYGPQGHGEVPYHFERKVQSHPEGKMVLNHLGQLVPEKKMMVRKKK